jgi:hypothetical protein
LTIEEQIPIEDTSKMGRKGISIRKKSGTRGSRTCTSRRRLVLPADQRSASKHPITADNAADDDANGDSADISYVPVPLELKAVVVGKERYLFGKGMEVLEEAAPALETASILSEVQNLGSGIDNCH